MDGRLIDLARQHAFVLVSPIRADAAVTYDGTSIWTWSVVRVLEEIENANLSRATCAIQVPSAVSLNPGEAAIRMTGGTLMIEGVSVTRPVRVNFQYEPARRYVLLADVCAGGAIELPMGGYAVFEVTPEGRLLPTLSKSLTYEQEILRLETLEKLRDYVRNQARS